MMYKKLKIGVQMVVLFIVWNISLKTSTGYWQSFKNFQMIHLFYLIVLAKLNFILI